MFNEYFSNVDENKFLDESLYGKSEEKAVSPEQTQTLPEGDNIADEIVENIIGDGFIPGNDDWKEAAWQRKLRKQSRIHLRQ